MRNLIETGQPAAEIGLGNAGASAKYKVKTQPRQRPENVKERIVVEKEYENIKLLGEQVAEFAYRPTACQRAYRVIALRKKLSVERGQQVLFKDYRYFFYITNDSHGVAGRTGVRSQRALQPGKSDRPAQGRCAGADRALG